MNIHSLHPKNSQFRVRLLTGTILLILQALIVGTGHAVVEERPGDFTNLNIERHLNTILKELPVYNPSSKTVTPDQPPSRTLQQAMAALEAEWRKVHAASDLHDLIPPTRTTVLQRCEQLKNVYTEPIVAKTTLEIELLKLTQRERYVDNARKEVTFRNWQTFVGAMGHLVKESYDSFKKLISPSPKDVKNLFTAIIKKMIKQARAKGISNPAGTAAARADEQHLGKNGLKYFLEHEKEIIQALEGYVKTRNFQPHELKNPKQIIKELFIFIRQFLRNRTKIELPGIRKRITEVQKELKKYTGVTLRPGSRKMLDYDDLCQRIRDLQPWKQRRMIALAIDPKQVTINVGDTVSFRAIGTYTNGTKIYVTNRVNWPNGKSFTGVTPGKFTILAEFRSLTAPGRITVVTTPKPPIRTPPGPTPTPGPDPGPEPVEPPTPTPTVPSPLEASFSCGDSFELSPNEVLYPKTCYVQASNFQTTREQVELTVQYDKKLIDVTFDEQSEVARIPNTEFLLMFRTRTTAPPTVTPVTIIVKHGNETVRIPITIAILAPNQESSRGPGIRPPATVATGSEGGTYCVWRSKSFGDGPNCFNITRAQCDSPRYAGKSKYELVGSSMTPMESAVRASQLSPYKDDAYGCHKQPPKPRDTEEGQDSGTGTGPSGGTGNGRGHGTGDDQGPDDDEGSGDDEGPDENKDSGEEQESSGEKNAEEEANAGDKEDSDSGEDPAEKNAEENLLSDFPDDPDDGKADEDSATREQEQAAENFSDGTPHSTGSTDPDKMVSSDSDSEGSTDVAVIAQGERDRQEAEDRDRATERTNEERQDTESQRETNRQDEEDYQTQEQAAQDNVQQAQAQGQAQIDAAQDKPDPRMSATDVTDAVQDIDDKTNAAVAAIDDQIQQRLGGRQGGPTIQPLQPPPDMGGGPVDTAVVQCDAKFGAGGDNPGFFTIDFNGAHGVAKFTYNMVSVKDQMIISAGGQTFDTTCRSSGEPMSISIPRSNSPVTVRVIPNCACKKASCTGTRWSFTFHCPVP